MDTRGRTPIIATILIVALILGLGSTVVAWVHQNFFALDLMCEDVSVEANRACIQDNELGYNVSNQGTPIQGYKLVTEGSGNISEMTVRTNVSTNGSFEDFKQVRQSSLEVEISPMLIEGDEEAVCNNKAINIVVSEC